MMKTSRVRFVLEPPLRGGSGSVVARRCHAGPLGRSALLGMAVASSLPGCTEAELPSTAASGSSGAATTGTNVDPGPTGGTTGATPTSDGGPASTAGGGTSGSTGGGADSVGPTTTVGGSSGSSPSDDTGEDTDTGGDDAIPSPGCGQPRSLSNGMHTITSGGIERTYFLQTPEPYDDAQPHRLVFQFHWNYGSINAVVNPPDADQNTDRPFYGMGDLADDRTIFVVPQGLLSNRGGDGWQNVDDQDVIFTDDMLAEVSSDLCIDEARVFATGFSFGASMSAKLACARSDVFRGAAVYNVGPLSGNDPAECTSPIAFFHSHGIDDPILNYAEGLAMFDVIARANGCVVTSPATPPDDGHSCVSYEGCSVPTRFCNFGPGQGNPHNPDLRGHYPSAKDPGATTSWIPAEAWSFITQF